MPGPDDQHARPIPVTLGSEPGGHASDGSDVRDDVYVVDTRVRGRRPAARATVAPDAARRAPVPQAVPPAPVRYDELGRPVPEGTSPRSPAPHGSRSRGRRGRRGWGRWALLLLVAWLAFVVITPLHAWSEVTRVDSAPTGGRPAAGSGTTYLLVGSDSREGLTAADRARLGTGSAQGRRTDSIILVHVPSGGGKPALVSVPRDSYLPIPGHGKNKVNAAFAIGGPRLLVETLEDATGLRIDGYVEIGFGGFADVVDSLGGVDICVPRDISDAKAHVDLTKGCQTLDGTTALGYVRARYSDPRGDLGRAERQRQFLGAIMRQAATPSTVLVPWRWWGFTHAAARGVLVGQDTSALDAFRIMSTLRQVSSGGALSLVVPISTANASTSAGSSVLWDRARAQDLFTMLREGTPLETPPAGTDGTPTGG